MTPTGSTTERKIWDYLISKGLSKCGVAGLMGNLYAESALNPKNLQNSYERSLGYTDDSYTAAVDNGKYGNFVRDSAGYGLAQWTYWSRKQNMLDFARSKGKSIGDLDMQLEFLYKELSENYKLVLDILKSATSVKTASDSVITNFERPADQSSAAKAKRASFGQAYYDKYAGTVSSTQTNESIQTGTVASGDVTYTVVKGDTLSGIAAKYHTTYQALAEYNNIANPNVISVGQVIHIPSNNTTTAEMTHAVIRGDTLSALAGKYGVTVDKIVSANKNKYPAIKADYIVVGWTLTIPR